MENPPTVKFPPIPAPPLTLNAPELTLPRVPEFVDVIKTFPLKDASDTKLENPPTVKFPPIPAPPLTLNAPVLTLPRVAEFVDVTRTLPLKDASDIKLETPPTFKRPPIPAPPPTISAPDELLVEGSLDVTFIVLKVELPEKLVVPLIATLPLTSNVTLGLIFPIPTNPPLVFIPKGFAPFWSAELIYPLS